MQPSRLARVNHTDRSHLRSLASSSQFLVYTYYIPMETMVPMMWKVTTGLNGCFLAWNIIEVFPTKTLKDNFEKFITLYFGFLASHSSPRLLSSSARPRLSPTGTPGATSQP